MSQKVFSKVPYPDIISMAVYEALDKPMVSDEGHVFYPKGWLRFLGMTTEEVLQSNGADNETK